MLAGTAVELAIFAFNLVVLNIVNFNVTAFTIAVTMA
jgi:hypothetical protein